MSANNHNNINNNQQQHLTEQLAARLVQGTRPNDSTNTSTNKFPRPIKACIAIAGGGSGAPSAIASIPGASSILLESIIAYDRRSYAEFVTNNILMHDEALLELEGMMEGTGEDAMDSSFSERSENDTGRSNDGDSFSFCSLQSAILLSRSALHRSLRLTPSFQEKSLHCIGVGCTSSLVGKLSSDGEEVGRRRGRKSRGYIACSTLGGGTFVWSVELDGGNNGGDDDNLLMNEGSEKAMAGTATARRRSRSQEESVISNLILLSMIRYCEQVHKPLLECTSDDEFSSVTPRTIDHDGILTRILDREGDSIAEKKIDNLSNNGGTTPADGASRIVNGDANIVAVLPVREGNINEPEFMQQKVPRMTTLFSDSNIPFPDDVLIVPGSFNPPHQGHVGLANAAVSALRRMRRNEMTQQNSGMGMRAYSSPYSSLSSVSSSSSILKNMWDTVDQYTEGDPTVFFEMSVTNADKPPLDPVEVERRVNLFATLLPSSEMPNDWAVILTNAPLFAQKTCILDELLMGRKIAESGTSSSSFGLDDQKPTNRRRMTFVLGTDTMVRIINPKYYGDSRDNMISALAEMQEKGVHFIVGGRLEQGVGHSPTFINGEEEVRSLPQNIQQMFTLLTEEEFRLDISSTELRKNLEQMQ